MSISVWLSDLKEISFYEGHANPAKRGMVMVDYINKNEDCIRENASITEWADLHMPFLIGVEFNASPERSKLKLRQWLSRNVNERWAFWHGGVRFSNNRDASLFRLYWG